MIRWLTILLVMFTPALAHGQDDQPLLFGGCGGVYLLAEPGELTVTVTKRGPNELRAVLVGPDRRPIDQAWIEDDGRATFTTDVPLRGVYALNITVSRDRYGEEIAWGVRTNCERYVIETSRGHRDARHEEPIVLRSPGRAGDICFAPIARPIDIDLSDAAADEAVLFDHDDRVIATIPIEDGVASHTVAADVPRDGPWRLHLPDASATVHIDGLTRWIGGDPSANHCIWTPDPGTWFPHMDNRWIITPYNLTVHGEAGGEVRATFTVHNHAPRARTIDLPDQSITLAPFAEREVTVTATVPSVTHITASPAGDSTFSTYATLIAKAGEPQVNIDAPLVLEPYRHENQQFGYRPDYPLDWEMHFDLNNRPSVRVDGGVRTLRDGEWPAARFGDHSLGAAKRASKIAFDADNDMYVLGSHGGRAILQHSTDGGITFAAYDIGGDGSLEIENFTGHNTPDGPPPVVRSVLREHDTRLKWRRVYELDLIIVDEVDGELVAREPVRLSNKSLGVASHSGVPAVVASRGSKVHIIWAEATDPDEDVPGVPTYVVTYDRDTGELDGKPVLIGYGAPPNDIHNRPCIVLDSKGYLHALTGTHGAPFQYARSLEPNTAHAGWTDAETVGEGLRQTYIGMVCDPDDTLHVMFRLWRSREAPHPRSYHAQLAYQRKKPGEPWQAPRPLVISPFSEYSIFYHRLNIDRRGRLFVSYDYWSTFWFYRNDHRGDRRALMMSPDGGETWRMVTGDHLR